VIYFIVALLVAIFSFDAGASQHTLSVPGLSVNSAGDLVYTFRDNLPRLMHPSLQTTVPLLVPRNSVSPQPVKVPVPVTIDVSPTKSAGALVQLARLSSPLMLGITGLSLLCDLASICKSTTDPNKWVYKQSGGQFDPSGNGSIYCEDNPLGTDRYVRFAGGLFRIWTIDGNPSNPYHANNCPKPGGGWYGVYRQRVDTLPPASERDVTNQDWDNAVSRLSNSVDRLSDIVSVLQDNNVPVPVNTPRVSPVSVTSPPLTKVIRDSLGNPIGTVTQTTITNVSPVSSVNNTDVVVNVTQTTITNYYNSDGNLEKSESDDGEPPPPEDYDVTFDSVSDVDLQHKDISPTLNVSSWGDGSCPPDLSVSILGHTVVLPVHHVCDYMIQMRTAVMLVFALISSYIVVGVSRGGST